VIISTYFLLAPHLLSEYEFYLSNDLHKMTAKLKPMNFDYELFLQAQQDFEKTELLRVNLMRLLTHTKTNYTRKQ
jgi:hypothetical protein